MASSAGFLFFFTFSVVFVNSTEQLNKALIDVASLKTRPQVFPHLLQSREIF